MRSLHFCKLQGVVVDENDAVCVKVPSTKYFVYRRRLRTPVSFYRENPATQQHQLCFSECILDQEGIIFAGDGDQNTCFSKGCQQLLVEAVLLRVVIEIPGDAFDV